MSFGVPEFDSRCLGRNAEHTPNDTDTAMRRVDVNRFFLSSDHSPEATDSTWLYVDERTGASNDDDDLAVASYIRLDVLRIALAIVDLFVVLHRCTCLSCCSCCWHSDGQFTAETTSAGSEVMRNGVTGSGIILCSKHVGARQQRKHRIGRAPNGSVSRHPSSFDICDEEEDFDEEGLCPLCRRRRRRRRRGGNASVKSALRRRGGGGMRRRLTPEQRRRRRHLAALLTRLVLCSIVVSLVYIVVRSLDAILAELMTVTIKQRSVRDLLVAETFLSEIFAQQVRRISGYFLLSAEFEML